MYVRREEVAGELQLQAPGVVWRFMVQSADPAGSVPMLVAEGHHSRPGALGVTAPDESRLGPAEVLLE